jgi:hypothetical protein
MTSGAIAKTMIAWTDVSPSVGMGDPVPAEPLGSVTVREREGDVTTRPFLVHDRADSAMKRDGWFRATRAL